LEVEVDWEEEKNQHHYLMDPIQTSIQHQFHILHRLILEPSEEVVVAVQKVQILHMQSVLLVDLVVVQSKLLLDPFRQDLEHQDKEIPVDQVPLVLDLVVVAVVLGLPVNQEQQYLDPLGLVVLVVMVFLLQ